MCGKIKNKREKKMTILVVFAFRLFCFSNTFAAQPLFFFMSMFISHLENLMPNLFFFSLAIRSIYNSLQNNRVL